MRAYRFLAWTIAVLVVVQAGAIAWGFFGVSDWVIDSGGAIDKEFLDCKEDCESIGSAEWGFLIHMFVNGLVLIPLTSLILLIVSFFAKVPGGVRFGAGIVGLVALQVAVLPTLSREVGSGFGALHGINAIVLMGVAVLAARRAAAVEHTPAEPARSVTV
jgi:hypothetical protein